MATTINKTGIIPLGEILIYVRYAPAKFWFDHSDQLILCLRYGAKIELGSHYANRTFYVFFVIRNTSVQFFDS